MLLEMTDIVMDFGPVRACDHVSIRVESGDIVGLLGENGAGKSTLMNVLAGTFPPTNGEIRIDGAMVKINTAIDAMKHGIRFIHQELNLCNDLRVFENMFLAQEIRGKGNLLDKKQMAQKCREVFERMRINLDPWAFVEHLAVADKQLIEIARALLFKCDLIIMDEPTTALSNNEVENLFEIMRQLKSDGVSFIYISHKMPEIFSICEKYYVLRDGKLIGNGLIEDVNEEKVTEMMIGRSIDDSDFSEKPYYGTDVELLVAKNLAGNGFSGINFTLHKGEVIAFTGLQSSGRDQLADAIYGEIPSTGTLVVNGTTISSGGIRRRLNSKLAMVPRNRKERGIHNELSIYDNLSMGYYNTKLKFPGYINSKLEKARYFRQQAALQIKADNPKNDIMSLSGGNQQKVILGRWLETDADILVFDNPTQGIDVGTKFEIYHLIRNLAAAGKGIIVFSSEFPEIYKIADTCMVMYKGAVTKVLGRGELTEKSMMYYSTGSNMEGMKNEQSGQ